jgi:osmotically-inducible protein OsmY
MGELSVKKWLKFAAAVATCCSLAVPASAQSGRQRTATENAASTAAPRAVVAADEDVRTRVQAALHADRYFYDAHVEVAIAKGRIVLRGFVFSDWDLRDATRIARKAAGDTPVISELTIKQGGLR